MKRSWLALIALAITLLQIAPALFLTEPHGIPAYEKLFQWDSGWYKSIAEHGYISTIPPANQQEDVSNVAFFPAYPITARVVHLLLPAIPLNLVLLLVAQLGAFILWLATLVVLDALTLSNPTRVLIVAALFCFPTSFFLVAAYSESFFMLGLVPFLAFARGQGRVSAVAAASGFVMTASRIAGVPVVVAGIVSNIFVSRAWRPSGRILLVAATALTGCLGFFAFCQLRFGVWNLYQITQTGGWNHQIDVFAVFRLKTWTSVIPPMLESEAFLYDVNALSRFLTSLCAWCLAIATVIELVSLRAGKRSERVAFLLGGWALFAISVAPMIGNDYVSMSRYLLPVHFCLMLWLAGLLSDLRSRQATRLAQALLLAATLAFLPVDYLLYWKFVSFQWVA